MGLLPEDAKLDPNTSWRREGSADSAKRKKASKAGGEHGRKQSPPGGAKDLLLRIGKRASGAGTAPSSGEKRGEAHEGA